MLVLCKGKSDRALTKLTLRQTPIRLRGPLEHNVKTYTLEHWRVYKKWTHSETQLIKIKLRRHKLLRT